MRFRFPQFLDVQDKIFGPFTVRQFSFLLAAVACAYIFWKLIPVKILAVPFILVFSGTFLALAFLKVNGRPFMAIMEAAYKFILNQKVYTWQEEKNTVINQTTNQNLLSELLVNKKNTNTPSSKAEKIRELASKLDILNSKNSGNN